MKKMKLTTGIPPLDDYLEGGWEPGSLVTLAHPIGAGGSLLALDTSIKQYYAGNKVLFLSIDLTDQVLRQRMACHLAGTKLSDLKSGYCDPERIEAALDRFRNAQTELNGWWSEVIENDDKHGWFKPAEENSCDVLVVDVGGIVGSWDYSAIKSHLRETGTVRLETARLNYEGNLRSCGRTYCSDYILKWKLAEKGLVAKAEFELTKCREKPRFQFTGIFNFERMRMEW